VSAGLAYSLYRLHVRPSLCRTRASEVEVFHLRRYTSVIRLCLCHSPNYHEIVCRVIVVAGSSAWNSLPDPVRNPNATKGAFRRLLKHFCSHGSSALSALGRFTDDGKVPQWFIRPKAWVLISLCSLVAPLIASDDEYAGRLKT